MILAYGKDRNGWELQMKIVGIVQARMESTRLPGKVMKMIATKPAIQHIVERIRQSTMIDELVVATSTNVADDVLANYCTLEKINVFRGSQDNVLERFYLCATKYQADVVIRMTGDNTLVDAKIIDNGIRHFLQNNNDYESYCGGLPLGMTIEIFTYAALKKAYEEAEDGECIEHVTPYIYRNPQLFQIEAVDESNYWEINSNFLKKVGVEPKKLRWTMDTEKDYLLIQEIYSTFAKKGIENFSYEDILKLYETHMEWLQYNSEVQQVRVAYKGNTSY